MTPGLGSTFSASFPHGQLLKWWSTAVNKCAVAVSRHPAAGASQVCLCTCAHICRHTHPPHLCTHTHTSPPRAMLREGCFHPQRMHTPPCTHPPTHTHPHTHLLCSGRDVSTVMYAQTPRTPAHIHVPAHPCMCARTLCTHTHTYVHTHSPRTPTMPREGRFHCHM